MEGCPEGVTGLWCGRNQLTTLEGCPEGVITLWCENNPFDYYWERVYHTKVKELIRGIKAIRFLQRIVLDKWTKPGGKMFFADIRRMKERGLVFIENDNLT